MSRVQFDLSNDPFLDNSYTNGSLEDLSYLNNSGERIEDENMAMSIPPDLSENVSMNYYGKYLEQGGINILRYFFKVFKSFDYFYEIPRHSLMFLKND